MRETTVADVPVRLLRVTFVGELGWELYCPAEYGAGLWAALWEAGQPHGLTACGYKAIDSLRAEKGYRYWGSDVTPDETPYEAGLGFCVKMDKDFIGREALAQHAESGPSKRLACLVIDDPRRVVPGQRAGPGRRPHGRPRDHRRRGPHRRPVDRLRLPARRAPGPGHVGRGARVRRLGAGRSLRRAPVRPRGRQDPVMTQTKREGMLTLEELRAHVETGRIDTVVVAITDMQGRLQGKRLHARYFLDEVVGHGTEGCNYLLAVDVDMNTVDGYAMSSWHTGYGDFVMRPGLRHAADRPVAARHGAGARRRALARRRRRRRLAAPDPAPAARPAGRARAGRLRRAPSWSSSSSATPTRRPGPRATAT